MKKSIILLFLLCLTMAFSACSTENSSSNIPLQPDPVETVSPTDTSGAIEETKQEDEVPVEDIVVPIYAEQLKDGSYLITVDSSSSMFRVVKCELIVENGAMKATMTMSGDGYGMVYMGTGEEALADVQENYVPFVLDEVGAKTFTVPVEALDMELDCAAWSIRKEKWYDRTLIFMSDELPADALIVE